MRPPFSCPLLVHTYPSQKFWTLLGQVVWVAAMETVGFLLIVGIDSLGVAACMYGDDFYLHWSGPCELLNHMVIVEYTHSFYWVLG